jgi:hypothetical protein
VFIHNKNMIQIILNILVQEGELERARG